MKWGAIGDQLWLPVYYLVKWIQLLKQNNNIINVDLNSNHSSKDVHVGNVPSKEEFGGVSVSSATYLACRSVLGILAAICVDTLIH